MGNQTFSIVRFGSDKNLCTFLLLLSNGKDSGEGVLTSVIREEEDRNYAKIPT